MQKDSAYFFSIIITTYNRAHVISRTLESVLAQTYSNYEVIIVDNRSEDNIKEVLQPYFETGKVKFYVNEENFERAVSRNRGMQYASGEYVTLLDSDDVLNPDFLKDAAAFAEKNPDRKVFHSLYNLQYEDGRVAYKMQFPKLTDNMSHLVNGNYLSCHAVFMHKNVAKSVQFDEEPRLIGHEDYDFWLRVVGQNQLGRINAYNSAMIIHESNSMKGFKVSETLWQKDYLIDKYKSDSKLSGIFAPYFGRFEATMFVNAAIQSNFKKTFERSIKLLFDAFKKDATIAFTKRYIVVLGKAILRR